MGESSACDRVGKRDLGTDFDWLYFLEPLSCSSLVFLSLEALAQLSLSISGQSMKKLSLLTNRHRLNHRVR